MGGLWAVLAWLGGMAAQLQQPELASWQIYAGGLLASCVGVAPCWRWARAGLVVPIFVAAFAFAGLRAGDRLNDELPNALEGQDVVVTGVIAQMPRVGASGTRFVLEVEGGRRSDAAVRLPQKIALGWYSGFGGLGSAGANAVPDLRAGQRWRLNARLRPPHGTMNPHGFDLELWLFEQGIRASGTVRPGAGNVRLGENLAHPFERLRQRIRDAIDRRIDDKTAAGILAALAIGDQGAVDRDDWALFRETGVAHAISISGLHVTMFAWLASGLVSLGWRRNRRLALWMPTPTAARTGGLIAAAAYALLAGWGVPAQRTVWMIATVVLLRGIGVRWPLMGVLAAAAAVVATIDPWALLQPGFWLSFVAVAMLIATSPDTQIIDSPTEDDWRQRLWNIARGGLRTQLIATVGLAPLSLVFFQQVSIVGFVANLLAIPLITLVITPLALLGALMPLLWHPAAWAVHGLMVVLAELASWPMAVWSAGAAPLWGVASGLLGGALLVLPLPWRLRCLGIPMVLPLLWPTIERPAWGRFEVVAADVGQGTAVLVRTAHRLLLYDTGPRYSLEADAGERVLLPLLRARGEDRIDLMMLSHRDADHVGGAASLLREGLVAAMSTSLSPNHPLLQSTGTAVVPHRPCAAGQTWTWDGVRFEVLHPLADRPSDAVKPNAVSCVLRVEGGDRSVLLAGDIEAAEEAALIARQAPLRSDAVLVPHHGSRTSSTAGFVAAVSPSTAVVQAAYRSRFGHPAPEVVQRWVRQGATVERTDACGAWTWPAEGPALCERVVSRRYWHHRVDSR